MMIAVRLDPLPTAAFAVVVGSWWAFAVLFLTRKRPPRTTTRRRDLVSFLGIGLQGASYGMAWGFTRPFFTPFARLGAFLGAALSVVTMTVAVLSVCLCVASVRTLGRQWSFQARLVEGHRLVTAGPYARVRNPIYTGMFGMLLATLLAVSRPVVAVPSVLLAVIGTVIRIRSEEGLLREAFGTEWDDYCSRTGALLPRFHGR